jgi:hypothetical protein
MAKAKKPATATLTYNGDLPSVMLNDGQYVLPKGEAVEVDMDTAKRFADNPFFDASNVTTDDPATSVAPEDALAAERAAHAAELDQAKKDYAEQLQKATDSLKAGWEEQHAADQAEIARLNGLLNNPAPAQPQPSAPAADAAQSDADKAEGQ